jgi:hypothetical protein
MRGETVLYALRLDSVPLAQGSNRLQRSLAPPSPVKIESEKAARWRMSACPRERQQFAWNAGMFEKSRRGPLGLFLVVGFLLAVPQNPRLPLNFSDSAPLTRTGQKEKAGSESDFDLSKLETGAVCTGAPEYATDTPPDISSTPAPAPGDALHEFQKDRKKAIMSLIHYPWEELGFKIAFMSPRLGYRAMTLTAQRRIEVYLRPGESAAQQAYDLAHELGHAFDLKYNDDERRRKWRELRGIKVSAPWFGCDACPDYGTPAGDFAETFAFLLLGPGNFHSLTAPLPSIDKVPELAAFCHIEHLSKDLDAQLKNKDRMEKVQTSRAKVPQAVQLPKANKTPDAAGNMSKSAQIPDAPEKTQILRGPEENLSDFESPQKEAPVELQDSLKERLFDIQLPEASQSLIPVNTR